MKKVENIFGGGDLMVVFSAKRSNGLN